MPSTAGAERGPSTMAPPPASSSTSTSASVPKPAAGPTGRAGDDAETRRQFVAAAAVMTAFILVLVVMFVALYPDSSSQGVSKSDQLAASRTQHPRIITKPSEGRAPESPGDPGGWEQLALFGAILVGLGTVAGLVWRSSRRARSRTGVAGPAG